MSVQSCLDQSYLDQSSDDLRLTLVAGEIDVRQFAVIESRSYRFPCGVRVDAAIIGASHAIRYQVGDECGWEVFACTEVREAFVLRHENLESLINGLSLEFAGQSYEIDVHRTSWEGGQPTARKLREWGTQPVVNELRLTHDFPPSEDSLTPHTSLRIWEQDGAVQVESVHTYPNDRQIVFTRSRLKPSKA